VVRWALALLTALVATASAAQISGSVSAMSDDRFRGVSLTQGRPAAQVEAAYDDDSGLYAGGLASNAKLDPNGGQQLLAVAYAGYARRLAGGWSADIGAAYSTLSTDTDYDYVELHAGLATEALSARLYYSPNYFGVSVHTLYGELNGSYRLTGRLKLIGHAGLLQIYSGANAQNGGSHPHPDLLVGGEYRIGAFSLQVARVFSDGASSLYPIADHAGGTLTARLSMTF
jgi:uncharacterized protein (TIGR02001 family)